MFSRLFSLGTLIFCTLLATSSADAVTPPVTPPTKIFVANQIDSTVSLIDLTAMKVVRTIPVGYSPYFVCVSGDQKTLAVAVEGEQKVKFYDTRTFRQKGEVHIGKMYAEHLIELPDGKSFIMANRFGNALLIIGFESMTIESRIENVSTPHNIRVGNTGKVVFATSKTNPGVSVVDLATRSVKTFVPMKFVPRGLASSPDDSYFYCGANWVAGMLVYESATGKLVRFCQAPLPGNHTAVIENTYHGLESANDSLVVATFEGLSALDIINARSGKLADRSMDVAMPGAILAWPGKPGWFVFTNMKNATVQTFQLSRENRIQLGPSVACGTGGTELPKRFTFFWGTSDGAAN